MHTVTKTLKDFINGKEKKMGKNKKVSEADLMAERKEVLAT